MPSTTPANKIANYYIESVTVVLVLITLVCFYFPWNLKDRASRIGSDYLKPERLQIYATFFLLLLSYQVIDHSILALTIVIVLILLIDLMIESAIAEAKLSRSKIWLRGINSDDITSTVELFNCAA